MRILVRKFALIAGLFGLVLIGLRFSHRVLTSPESASLEEPAPVPATIAQSKPSLRRQLPKTFRGSEPAPEPVTSPPIEIPQDPDELREWARQNPHEALNWLQSADAGQARDTVAEIVCARVADSNPAEAVSLAERYSGGCSNLLENLVHQWSDQNEPAATAYAISKPPGEERDRLLSRVAFTRSKESPIEAAKLVAEWISPGELQNEAAISVLHQWALRDPNAALAWAQTFPNDGLRARAVTEVENTFAKPPE
jgi:hypothetical protein